MGNIGVLLILVMYLSLQTDKISSNSLIYSLLNALGALLILISLYFQFNLSAFIIEFFWLVISLYGLYKNLKNKKIN
ncbi:CBU_0592 family membrane protein [Malaciobacter marinus]|uniref:CBU_0592 family membrane protein n=1 Tax=Malaciobacter marinus TaxID=505249 RepID=UPI0039173E27